VPPAEGGACQEMRVHKRGRGGEVKGKGRGGEVEEGEGGR